MDGVRIMGVMNKISCAYLGTDRRINGRRVGAERRDVIRYEVLKELRRSKYDRRRGYGIWSVYSRIAS